MQLKPGLGTFYTIQQEMNQAYLTVSGAFAELHAVEVAWV